mgnify:CR=1 FL=1
MDALGVLWQHERVLHRHHKKPGHVARGAFSSGFTSARSKPARVLISALMDENIHDTARYEAYHRSSFSIASSQEAASGVGVWEAYRPS